MKRLKTAWARLEIYFDVFMNLSRYMQQSRLYGNEFMVEEYHKQMRRNTMFSIKMKSFVKRLLYGSDWEDIEHEVYAPICSTGDNLESQCINIYGQPKGINCGETFGELYKEIKDLKQCNEELTSRLEDLKLTTELTTIQLVNLRIEMRTCKGYQQAP
jgi:hypothetical protein